VRRLKANWLAAPTVTTVTRCLSSRTIVNYRDRQQNAQFQTRCIAVHGGSLKSETGNVIGFSVSQSRTVTATERHQDALLPAARAHSAYSGSLAPINAASTCSSSSSGSYCSLGTSTLSLHIHHASTDQQRAWWLAMAMAGSNCTGGC